MHGPAAGAAGTAVLNTVTHKVDRASGASLGNVPLVWFHIEAVRTMYILDAERRRARYGSAGPGAW